MARAALPGLRQVDAQLDPHVAMGDAVLERGLERLNGVRRPAALPVDERQVAIGVGGVRPPRDHLLERLRGLSELSLLIEVAGTVEHRVDLDQALGIVGLAVTVARRGGAAADVTERTQAIADGRRLFARHRGRSHVEPAQRVEQDFGPSAVGRRQVALFARIGVERVEFLRRQVDVLVPADDDPAKRRPAARQIRRHRLEVRRPILAAAAPHHLDERRARQRRGRRCADCFENGGHDVDVAYRRIDGDPAVGSRRCRQPAPSSATMSGTRSVGS